MPVLTTGLQAGGREEGRCPERERQDVQESTARKHPEGPGDAQQASCPGGGGARPHIMRVRQRDACCPHVHTRTNAHIGCMEQGGLRGCSQACTNAPTHCW